MPGKDASTYYAQNISSHRFCCGLYSLALGVNYAVSVTNVDYPSTFPKGLRDRKAFNFQDDGHNIDGLATVLKQELSDAMKEDDGFKLSQREEYVSVIYDDTKYTDNFYQAYQSELTEKIRKTIKDFTCRLTRLIPRWPGEPIILEKKLQLFLILLMRRELSLISRLLMN